MDGKIKNIEGNQVVCIDASKIDEKLYVAKGGVYTITPTLFYDYSICADNGRLSFFKKEEFNRYFREATIFDIK